MSDTDRILGLLGEHSRARGGLLGYFLPESENEKIAREYRRMQMQAMEANVAENQRRAFAAQEEAARKEQERAKAEAFQGRMDAAAGQMPMPQQTLDMLRATGPVGGLVPGMTPMDRMKAAAGGNIGALDKLSEIEARGPKWGAPQTELDASGRPVIRRYSDRDPSGQTVEGFAPKPDMQVIDRGGTKDAVDLLRTPSGTQFGMSMTPGQQDDSKRGWANVGLRREELGVKRSEVDAMREIGGGQANRELGKLVSEIRKEYNGVDAVKNFKAAAPIVASIPNAPDTPAGDLDFIYAVGKVLDPGSVVREGEMNLVIKAGSPLQRFQGYVRAITQGRGRLPPTQRAQLEQMLSVRMAELKRAHDTAAAPYVEQAKRMGLPMSEIFQEGKPEATGGVVDFSALPKGK